MGIVECEEKEGRREGIFFVLNFYITPPYPHTETPVSHLTFLCPGALFLKKEVGKYNIG